MSDKEKFYRAVVACVVIALIGMFATGILQKRNSELKEYINEIENAPADTVVVVKHDTIKIDKPVPSYKYIKEREYVKIKDTMFVHDTTKELVFLPREYMVYKDSSYRAVVSGVDPRLDSIEVYGKTVTNTITKTVVKTKKTRWGLGPQIAVGWDGKKIAPYVGVGVQYNLIAF